jgi:hypothetical protein
MKLDKSVFDQIRPRNDILEAYLPSLEPETKQWYDAGGDAAVPRNVAEL